MSELVEDEDFYWEGGFVVFTRHYHLKRGYCCGSGCRHCPYDPRWTGGETTNTTTLAERSSVTTLEIRVKYASKQARDGALATGIQLEHCTLIDDGRVCALEYNIVRRGEQYLPPQAGVAVYVRDPSGKLATARLYDDADPPLGQLPAL